MPVVVACGLSITLSIGSSLLLVGMEEGGCFQKVECGERRMSAEYCDGRI